MRQLPNSSTTKRMRMDILEDMYAMIHQRRVPPHADRGYCHHGLLQLYVQLQMWGRHLNWLSMRRDLEESTDRKLACTATMLRLAEQHCTDPDVISMLPRCVLDFSLEPHAPPHVHAQLYHLKSGASYQLWRATQNIETLDQAIHWAELACESYDSEMYRSALQKLLEARSDLPRKLAKPKEEACD